MKEFLGRIKADFLLSSVLCIALGLVSFGAHDSGQCACGSAYHHRSGLYVQLFFEYSYKWFFSDAGACGFGSGYMVSGTAKGCGEPDTYSHRSGAHFSQHQEHY